MNRRKFLRTSLLSAIGVSLATGVYSWQIEPFMLEFVKVKMPIKGLPKDLTGKTLMQISDIHVGNRFDHQWISEAFIEAKTLNPDIVVYTGDYVSYEDAHQFVQLEEVLKHAPTGALGTFGILGNHDYGNNWSEQSVANEIKRLMQSAGIRVLQNETIKVEGLQIVGFDDLWGLNFNPAKALQEYDRKYPSIALCHNPDACDLEIWKDYNGWILSGHTHGGQCKPPFLDPPVLPVVNKRYTSGTFDLGDGRTLYINRALGHLWQVRFNVRPEITVFELVGT